MSDRLILLVNDNPKDEELTLRALKQLRFPVDVVVSRDGTDALDYLFGLGKHAGRDSSIQPELILLDLELPKLGGLEVLRRIRQDRRTRLNPVVVIASSSLDRDIVRSYRLGANSFLSKAVDVDDFSEAIRLTGAYWLGLNLSAVGRESNP